MSSCVSDKLRNKVINSGDLELVALIAALAGAYEALTELSPTAASVIKETVDKIEALLGDAQKLKDILVETLVLNSDGGVRNQYVEDTDVLELVSHPELLREVLK